MIKELIRLVVVLTLICVVAAGSVAATEGVTSQIIAERKATEQLAAVQSLLPEAEQFVEEEKDGTIIFRGMAGENLVGAAFIVEPAGYGGPIKMAVGVDPEGKVTGVTVIQQDETAGLGGRIAEAKFLDQFTGKTADDPLRAGQDIQAVAGATISSNAAARGVKTALETYKVAVAGGGEGGPVDIAQIPDGTYRGQGEGFHGPIVVDVTVAAGKITKVEIVEQTETPSVSAPALEQIPGRIVEAQSAEVDVVAGASLTSKGIMAAVTDALANASKVDVSQLPDGTYAGEGEGFGGPIKVEVTIAGGKITKVEIVEQSETPSVSAPAREQLPAAIVEAQSAEVDGVAGATLTSNGIIEAVQDALAKAKK